MSCSTRALFDLDQTLPGLAWREQLPEAVGVEPAHRAVDPAEAQRLLDGIVVAEGGDSVSLLADGEPDTRRRRVVLGKPLPPLGAAWELDERQVLEAWLLWRPARAGFQAILM